MAGKNLFRKIWESHAVAKLPTGQTQLFIGLHLVHEVTSPQAFDMMREQGLRVAFADRTYATVDHIVPTLDQARPFGDQQAEAMMRALEITRKSSASDRLVSVIFVGTYMIGPKPGDSAWYHRRLRRQPHQHSRSI